MNRILYTWLDVDFVLQSKRAAKEWPVWLRGASSYHDGLLLRVADNTNDKTVKDLLTSWFSQRYLANENVILLHGIPDQPKKFPVTLESVQEATTPVLSVEPTFKRLALFPEGKQDFQLPEPFPKGSPQVYAFYSFKGGVGRTTHLLAFWKAISLLQNNSNVLVIDADLEAPGITSLVKAEPKFGNIEFSFVDLLGLAHSDLSENFQYTLEVASFSLRRQSIEVTAGELARHYVLPAFRTESQSLTLDLRPEHLVSAFTNHWIVGDLLTSLGRRLAVDYVLIDLRAGLSELASPILFDPRINRVAVSTLSRQSTDGTKLVLGEMNKVAPNGSDPEFSDPMVILSFVTKDLAETPLVSDMKNSLQQIFPDPDDELDPPRIRVEQSSFSQELLYLASLTDSFEKLGGTGVEKLMSDLASETGSVPTDSFPPQESLNLIRSSLSQLAATLEYAESGKGDRFLTIAPIRSLATAFSEVAPIAVIIGAKGAGKTYTFLQIIRNGLWSSFLDKATNEPHSPWGILSPILQSKNLEESARDITRNCRVNASLKLGTTNPASLSSLEDAVVDGLAHSFDETAWRQRWFQIIGDSLGIKTSSGSTAAGEIVQFLKAKSERLIVLFDGLEDLFPDIERTPIQQNALRALLQGVPNYLRDVPECPLGILVFVRADLARAAITQNYGQFQKMYESFALRWNEEEALRLAAWLANEAGANFEQQAGKKLELLTLEEAKELLKVLWGKKLGPEGSREARSAEWVIAALSDFRGQIQARDLVRLLGFAAAKSLNTNTPDRILAHRAIRDAIAPCSTKKIAEIEQEIPPLTKIFSKLRNHTNRRIPFGAAESGLSVPEIRFLESVGVIVEDRGEYYIPEIFRLGLGFQLAKGKRPRVLTLTKRSE